MDDFIDSEAYAKARELDHTEVMNNAASFWIPLGMAKVARGRLLIAEQRVDAFVADVGDERTPRQEVARIISTMEPVWFGGDWTCGEAPLKSEQLLYVATCEDYIKIGIASDPGQRLRDMQVGNPFEMAMHSVWRPTNWPAITLEGNLHYALREYSVRGEWFRNEALEFFNTPQATAQKSDQRIAPQ
jgi:hypothetical protein